MDYGHGCCVHSGGCWRLQEMIALPYRLSVVVCCMTGRGRSLVRHIAMLRPPKARREYLDMSVVFCWGLCECGKLPADHMTKQNGNGGRHYRRWVCFCVLIASGQLRVP
jgi:hypothetical protein